MLETVDIPILALRDAVSMDTDDLVYID